MHSQSTTTLTRDEMIVRLLGLGDISVDEEGRVWRHGKRVGNTFSPYPAPRRIDHATRIGYRVVKLGWFGVRFGTSAHRMQWIKHHGPIPDGLEVNHKDRDKANNRIDNLELLTHSQNIQHAVDANGGTWVPTGEDHHEGKLTWEKVRFIRAEVKAGRLTVTGAAKRFGVSQPMVSGIMSGRYWKEERSD